MTPATILSGSRRQLPNPPDVGNLLSWWHHSSGVTVTGGRVSAWRAAKGSDRRTLTRHDQGPTLTATGLSWSNNANQRMSGLLPAAPDGLRAVVRAKLNTAATINHAMTGAYDASVGLYLYRDGNQRGNIGGQRLGVFTYEDLGTTALPEDPTWLVFSALVGQYVGVYHRRIELWNGTAFSEETLSSTPGGSMTFPADLPVYVGASATFTSPWYGEISDILYYNAPTAAVRDFTTWLRDLYA